MWADAQRDGRPVEYRWRPLRKFHPCTATPQSLAAGVPCINAASRERKTWTQWVLHVAKFRQGQESLYIVCQPRRRQMSCKVSLTSVERRRCNNDQSQDAKSVEICSGAPNSRIDLSRCSAPMFTILWGHVEEILPFNKFFSDCRYMP